MGQVAKQVQDPGLKPQYHKNGLWYLAHTYYCKNNLISILY
jgi:hypothetical protein